MWVFVGMYYQCCCFCLLLENCLNLQNFLSHLFQLEKTSSTDFSAEVAVDFSGIYVPISLERTDNAVMCCSMHSLFYFLIPELPCTCSFKTQLIFAHLHVITIPLWLFLPLITHLSWRLCYMNSSVASSWFLVTRVHAHKGHSLGKHFSNVLKYYRIFSPF